MLINKDLKNAFKNLFSKKLHSFKCWDDIKRIEETIEKTSEEPLEDLYDDIPRCTDNKNLFSIKCELQGCYMDDAFTKEL